MEFYVDSSSDSSGRSHLVITRQQRQGTCPGDFSPCTCSGSGGSLAINCKDKKSTPITDDNVATAIAKIPTDTLIPTIDFRSATVGAKAKLTKIPPGLNNLTSVGKIYLSTNQITVIKTGELAVNSTILTQLELSENQITAIEDNSLPGKLYHIEYRL